MENMRQKVDLNLHPLGRFSQPCKGVVCEDLGRTDFTSGPARSARKVPKSFEIQQHASPPESDDDLDAFSFKNAFKLISHESVAERPYRRGRAGVQDSHRKDRRQSLKAEFEVIDENVSSDKQPRPPLAFRRTGSPSSQGDMPPSSWPATESKRTKNTSEDRARDASPLEELSANRTKRLKTSIAQKTQPDPFPMNIEHKIESRAIFSKHSSHQAAPFLVGVPSQKSSIQKLEVAPFPLGLPSLQRETGLPRPFPMEDWCTRPHNDSKNDEDELKMTENDNILTYGGPRPFPMSALQFSMETAPISRQHMCAAMSRSPSVSEDFEELSLDEDESVDPSTICPYCDELWPPEPSPLLISLLEHTKRRSYADPRHGNALGLKAPLAVFIELCQRHRFEMKHLPLARERGWPTYIDFASLPKRIGAFRQELRKLLQQPEESKYWREVRDDAKKAGMTKIASVTGQYATFERTQPGYYGVQGSIIIHQSLYSLFPPDTIPTTNIIPLTPDQFLTRVLVPETALLLIQQDMDPLTKEEAMHTLDSSKEYGVAMFPEQAQGEEIGEQLARDRAKVRRKVLEDRGEADADIWREVERERQRTTKRNEKASSKDHANEEESLGIDLRSNPEKPRNKVKMHSKAVVTNFSYQKRNQNCKIGVQGADEEPRHHPSRADENPQENSATSRRSNASPSTPLFSMSRTGDCTTSLSSQYPNRNAARNLPWSKLCDEFTPSGRTSATKSDEATIVTFEHKPVSCTDDSGADVCLIIDTGTLIPRAFKNFKSDMNIITNENGSEATFPVAFDKNWRRPELERKIDASGDVRMKGLATFGQTKRRKKK